jgi:hypothetical protein
MPIGIEPAPIRTGTLMAGRPHAFTQPVKTVVPRGPTAWPSICGGNGIVVDHGMAAQISIMMMSIELNT